MTTRFFFREEPISEVVPDQVGHVPDHMRLAGFVPGMFVVGNMHPNRHPELTIPDMIKNRFLPSTQNIVRSKWGGGGRDGAIHDGPSSSSRVQVRYVRSAMDNKYQERVKYCINYCPTQIYDVSYAVFLFRCAIAYNIQRRTIGEGTY